MRFFICFIWLLTYLVLLTLTDSHLSLDGFNRVFPIEKLSAFTPEEIKLMLCGDQYPRWTREDILAYTEPKLGFTKERWVVCLMN